VPWMSTTGGGWKRKPTEQELTTMKYRDGDLGDWLDVKSAEVTVYHMWDESQVGVKSLDAATRTIRFSSELGHPPGAFGVKRYVVWNVKAGLKRPGQWYLDRSRGRVVYWPLPGQDMTHMEALAPVVENAIRIAGTDQSPARDITLQGLTIMLANTPLKAGGFAAMAYPGAIELDHAPGCRIERTSVMNVAGQGIRAYASPGLRIERCTVHDTGACGLDIATPGAVVADTRVHDVGILYPSAAGIVANSARDVVEHCEIHDTPYSAVIGGGDDSRFEGNLIYRAMQELHDGGGIYMGFCKGAILRHNVIRDIVDTGGYGASAYYLDEQAHDCIVEDNLSVNVARPSQNHMAHDNAIRNNVFVVDGDASLDFARCKNYTFEGNVIRARGAIAFHAPEGCLGAMPGNVLFSEAGRVELSRLTDYARGPANPLTPNDGSVLLDPLFLDPAHGDYRFRTRSPALKMGLKQHDWRDAGPRKG